MLLLSFPHNPTTTVVELDFMEHVVGFAREREMLVVHDFAYADLAFDGHEPPSILQVPGAADVAVELYTLTKSFSMAGWRVGFLVGNAEVCGALARLKCWLDYGTFQPIQIAADHRAQRGAGHARRGLRGLSLAADALCDGLDRAGWAFRAARDDVRLGAGPEPFAAMGSLAFAEHLAREGRSRSPRDRASAREARASSASRSSRTSTGSARPCAGIRRVLRELC